MTPSKINQNELDELMDKAVRKGVAAAILAAQDAGLVKFPVPLFGLKDAEERIDGIVGTFIEVVKRSEEHTSELQSLMRISYAVFCLKKKKDHITKHHARSNERAMTTHM